MCVYHSIKFIVPHTDTLFKANLEKQVKALQVRIVDLETKAFASSPRHTSASRKADHQIPRQTTGTGNNQDERNAYETKIADMRKKMNDFQAEGNNAQLAKRRAERDAADTKQKALK